MPRDTRWRSYPNLAEAPHLIEKAGLRRAGRHTETPPADDGGRQIANRARIVIFVFLVMVLAVLARLVQWQIIGRSPTAAVPVVQAAETRRGRILDSKGQLLATDSFTWEIYVRPNLLREKISPQLTASVTVSLTQILGLAPGVIQANLGADADIRVLKKDVGEEQARQVNAIGVAVLKNADLLWADDKRVRTYPLASLGAQVLGCADLDLQGLYGVEATYDTWLKAEKRWAGTQLPGKPAPIPDTWRRYLPSASGHDLVLHLNSALQLMADKRLADAMAAYEAEAGTIVIEDPRSGALLALAHQPNFDPNLYYMEKDDVWIRSAVSQIYEPGSVFKLMTYAAALDSGQITPETEFDDKGTYAVGGSIIKNAERVAYGKVTANTALAKSLNVVSAQIAMEMGPETFYRYLRAFGFSKPSEVDLPSESHGLLKEPGNVLWSRSDQATNSFGQALSVTALQMTNAVAAIANGGQLLQPQAARALVLDGQMYTLPPRVLRQVIKPETARTLTDMMVYAVDRSAYPKMVPGYRIAGKTGTAEIATETGYNPQETIVSFVGFLPAEQPQVVIMVKLIRPKKSVWAEHTAMPTFGLMASDAVRILRIAPGTTTPSDGK